MSYVKIMVHAVWGTKNREPFLTQSLLPVVIDHIQVNAKTKNIFIDSINGHTEHIHCLLGLNSEMSIAKALQLMKGESAFWINKQGLTKTKFEWADEYFAVSVSESLLNNVRTYIRNQQEHHQKKTFQQEYDEFIKKYNF